MFFAFDVPIISAQFVAQQMRLIDSLVQSGPENFLSRRQGYKDVHAVSSLPPPRTETPDGSSVTYAAL